MATQPPAAPRYDWEPPLTSERPDDLPSSDLPDITAPATDALPTEDEHVPAPDPVPPPRRRFPPLAIVAIVLVVVAGMVAGLGIVAATVVGFIGGSSEVVYGDESSQYSIEPAVVLDGDGNEIADSTGGYDTPAIVGEHTIRWEVWTGGTLELAATAIDTDATVPGAAGAQVLQPGYRLVTVTFEAVYAGAGEYLPDGEIYLAAESEAAPYYVADIAAGLLPHPLVDADTLTDGQTATFEAAFVLPDDAADTLLVSVETMDGEIMCYDAR